ncbi:MAG TPA: large conductance mechanosensitive channel protein MscL [Bryobacteraceae bacterium]|nr:large conductance mechanosensitive channel protein MscL [Bryobacteraceae bacterium]
MLKEFKEFILRGNVLDLAVAVVIGAAFGSIVTSLVNDILMPPIGMLLHGVDFSNLYLVLKGDVPAGTALVDAKKIKDVVTINYGLFLNAVINFLIIGFAIFLVVKSANKAMPKPVPAPAPTTKDCPFCCTTIAAAAKRCPHCTSSL